MPVELTADGVLIGPGELTPQLFGAVPTQPLGSPSMDVGIDGVGIDMDPLLGLPVAAASTQVPQAVLPTAAPLIESALALVRTWLGSWLEQPGSLVQLQQVLGDRWSLDAGRRLIHDVVTGTHFPGIEVLGAEQLPALGAFRAQTNQIYLSQAFLDQQVDLPIAVATILLEEIGHYLDTHLNGTDTRGDEGALFAALVQGQTLTPQTTAMLQAEDDTITLTLATGEVIPD